MYAFAQLIVNIKIKLIFYLRVNKFSGMKLVKFFLPAIFCLLLFSGCDSGEVCLSNQHALRADFLSAWSETDKDSTLSNVSLVGVGRTDSIYRNQTTSDLFMPLDFKSDTSSFVLFGQTRRDTIRVVHKSELDFISGECGYIFAFEIDTVMHTEAFIDSISIEYPFIKYGESTENIKIYIY